MTQHNAYHAIDGEHLNTGTPVTSINPATGAVIGVFPAGGRIEAEAAISAARRAFDESLWAQAPRARQMVLLRWADAMERDAEALADLLTRTNGKPFAHSRGEIAGSVSEIRYYAGLARHNPGHALEVSPGEFSIMMREPAGVAGLVIPWNAPAVLLIRALAPALAVGCAVVIKPAPQTALLTARCLAPLLADEEMPKGVVNVVYETGNEAVQVMAASEDVDVISFTGSHRVGTLIAQAAAPTMKKLSLELGGKSACLVLKDANIDAVAPQLAAAATIISGQQCTAARRVLVHESRYQAMQDALVAALAALRVGDGLDPDTQMGPLIDRAARDAVWTEIEACFDAADAAPLRGAPMPGPEGSAFLSPSLIAHADDTAPFCQDEIFGPLLVVEPFTDEAHAVAKANNSQYGLSASVWTTQTDAAWRVARALRNGTVWINDHNKLFAEAETGGYRRSGLGRLHGVEGLLDFCELKHVYQSVGTLGAPG